MFAQSLGHPDSCLKRGADSIGGAWEMQTLGQQLLKKSGDACADPCLELESAVLTAAPLYCSGLESSFMHADLDSHMQEAASPAGSSPGLTATQELASPAGSSHRLPDSRAYLSDEAEPAVRIRPAALCSGQLGEMSQSVSQQLNETLLSETFLGKTLQARVSADTASAAELKTLRPHQMREQLDAIAGQVCADTVGSGLEVAESRQSCEHPAGLRTDCIDGSQTENAVLLGTCGVHGLSRSEVTDYLDASQSENRIPAASSGSRELSGASVGVAGNDSEATLLLSFRDFSRTSEQFGAIGGEQPVELRTLRNGLEPSVACPGGDVQVGALALGAVNTSRDFEDIPSLVQVGEATSSDTCADSDDVLRCARSRLNASREACQLAAHRARCEAWQHISPAAQQSPVVKADVGRIAPASQIRADSAVILSTVSSLGADSCAHTEPTPSRSAAVLPPQLPGRCDTGQKSKQPSNAQRRGGEEVVVDSPQTVQNRLHRLQARENKQRRSLSANRGAHSSKSEAELNPTKLQPPPGPRASSSPSDGAANKNSEGQLATNAPATVVPAMVSACPPQPPATGLSSRPPSRPVSGGSLPPPSRQRIPPGELTPASSSRPPSVDSARPRRASASSQGRRPSCDPSSARSSSAGPGGSSRRGVQSNRKLIRSYLEKHCLKGDVNREQRENILQVFDQELAECQRFIIVFRSIHTGRHDLRSLYAYKENGWVRVFQILPSPPQLEERMVGQFLRYDSGNKEFREIPSLQEMLNAADAVFMKPQYLQKSRVVS